MIWNRLRALRPGPPQPTERSRRSADGQPLAELARELVRLSDTHASTPVLVTPNYLSLQPAFFVALARQIDQCCGRALRIDWHRRDRGWASGLTDRWARLRAARINRALTAVNLKGTEGLASRSDIALTAMIGRPGGVDRKIVVGLCDEGAEIPAWATPIHLGGAVAGELSFG